MVRTIVILIILLTLIARAWAQIDIEAHIGAPTQSALDAYEEFFDLVPLSTYLARRQRQTNCGELTLQLTGTAHLFTVCILDDYYEGRSILYVKTPRAMYLDHIVTTVHRGDESIRFLLTDGYSSKQTALTLDEPGIYEVTVAAARDEATDAASVTFTYPLTSDQIDIETHTGLPSPTAEQAYEQYLDLTLLSDYLQRSQYYTSCHVLDTFINYADASFTVCILQDPFTTSSVLNVYTNDRQSPELRTILVQRDAQTIRLIPNPSSTSHQIAMPLDQPGTYEVAIIAEHWGNRDEASVYFRYPFTDEPLISPKP